MITNIDHINIVVCDLERMVDFYTRVLGLRETRRAHLQGTWIEAIVGLRGVDAEVVYVEPPQGGLRIELLHYRAPAGVALAGHGEPNALGLRHIALRVEDLAAAVARLRAEGVEIFGEPVVVPGAVVNHSAGQKVLVYFRDPEGVLLELTEYR